MIEVPGEVIEEKSGVVISHHPLLKPGQLELDRNGKAYRGHLVVETRAHRTCFSQMSPDEAAGLGYLIQKYAARLEQLPDIERVYVHRIGDVVQHIHFHLIPLYKDTPKEFWGGHKVLQWPNAPVHGWKDAELISSQLKGI